MNRFKGWASPGKAKGVWHFFPNGLASVCGKAKSLGARQNKPAAGAAICKACAAARKG